jgi:hypothetical protein
VGFARNPYCLHRSFRDFTSSSRADWMRSARPWKLHVIRSHMEKKKSQDGCAEQVIFKHTCTVSSVFTSCSNLTIPCYNSIFFSYTYNKIMWYSSAKCKKKIKKKLAYMLYMLMLWIGGQAIFYCTCMSRNVASSVVNLDDTSPTCLYLASYFFVRFSTWN